MLYQSRWAPSQQTKKSSASRKTDSHRNDVPQASSSSSVSESAAQPDNFSGWSDPALRMIDEEANRMDIDLEVFLHGYAKVGDVMTAILHCMHFLLVGSDRREWTWLDRTREPRY